MNVTRRNNARRLYLEIEVKRLRGGLLSSTTLKARGNAERILRQEGGYTNTMMQSLYTEARRQAGL